MQPASSSEPVAASAPSTAPLPTLVWSRQHDYRLQKLGPSSLAVVSRFGPVLHLSLVGWFVLLAVVATGIALGEYNHTLSFSLWIACGVCLTVALVLLILPRFRGPFLVQTRFDRASNILDLAPWGLQARQRLPLDTVSGVQVLAIGQREDDSGPYDSYQLNLVLGPERVHVIENGNPTALRLMAGEIAGFLRVPLVEQSAPGPEKGDGGMAAGEA